MEAVVFTTEDGNEAASKNGSPEKSLTSAQSGAVKDRSRAGGRRMVNLHCRR
jgi:hypothetical protein